MYDTILVPVDMAHVEKAEAMINAAKTQTNEGARIILLNVIDAVPNWAEVYIPDSDILADQKKLAHDELVTVASDNGIEADIEVRVGYSYNTILEVAEKDNAELIIIGSHRPGYGDYFLGSTAAKVVRHAKCSVYVVRQKALSSTQFFIEVSNH